MPFKRYQYNGVEVSATRRRPSTRDDKKYMREVRRGERIYLVHYGDPQLPMRRDEPARREAFLERHDCANKRDPLKPGFWACYDWYNVREKMNLDETLWDVLGTVEVQQALGRAVVAQMRDRLTEGMEAEDEAEDEDDGMLVQMGRRWVARYSNNAKDVQRETVTAAAHRDFVARFQRGEVNAPMLLMNHDGRLVLGKADRAEVVEMGNVVFPVFSGMFADTVGADLASALHGRAMSHGMPLMDVMWRENDPHQGVIERYNSVELSVLVGAAPANPYTEFLSKGEGNMDVAQLAQQLGVEQNVIEALMVGVQTDAHAIVTDGVETKAKPATPVVEVVEEEVSFTLEQLTEAVQSAYRSGLETGVDTARKSLAVKARELSGNQLAQILLGKSAVGVGEELPAAREAAARSVDSGRVELSAFFGGQS